MPPSYAETGAESNGCAVAFMAIARSYPWGRPLAGLVLLLEAIVDIILYYLYDSKEAPPRFDNSRG